MNTEAVAQHRAKVEETAMKLSDTRDRLSKIGRDIYEHRNWLNGWKNVTDIESRRLTGEHARRTGEVERLETLRRTVKAECDALESELDALRAQHFGPDVLLAERVEAYRSAVATWEAAGADKIKFQEQKEQAAHQLAKASAELNLARRKVGGLLSIAEVTEANMAVAEAERNHASQEALCGNIDKALSDATARKKAAAEAVKMLEREMLAAKVAAVLDALRKTPAFGEVRQALELAFAAGFRAERWGSYDRFLAHAFMTEEGVVCGGGERMKSLFAENVQALDIVDVVES